MKILCKRAEAIATVLEVVCSAMICRCHRVPQLFPRVRSYDVEDVRGFFLQMSLNQSRTMYQLFMELMTGDVIPMETTKS